MRHQINGDDPQGFSPFCAFSPKGFSPFLPFSPSPPVGVFFNALTIRGPCAI